MTARLRKNARIGSKSALLAVAGLIMSISIAAFGAGEDGAIAVLESREQARASARDAVLTALRAARRGGDAGSARMAVADFLQGWARDAERDRPFDGRFSDAAAYEDANYGQDLRALMVDASGRLPDRQAWLHLWDAIKGMRASWRTPILAGPLSQRRISSGASAETAAFGSFLLAEGLRLGVPSVLGERDLLILRDIAEAALAEYEDVSAGRHHSLTFRTLYGPLTMWAHHFFAASSNPGLARAFSAAPGSVYLTEMAASIRARASRRGAGECAAFQL